MPHRSFKDLFGRMWDVWEVAPSPLISGSVAAPGEAPAAPRAPRHRAIRGEFEHGWLAFQWADERRRLAPVPEGWTGLDEDGLQRLLERSEQGGKLRRLIE